MKVINLFIMEENSIYLLADDDFLNARLTTHKTTVKQIDH